MAFITLPAIYDENMNFYPQGKLFSISTDGLVMPSRNLPITTYIPGTTDAILTYPLLCVKTNDHGELLFNMSLSQYNDLIRVAELDASAVKQLSITIIGTPNHFSSPLLIGTTLIFVNESSHGLYYPGQSTFNSATGTVTLAAGNFTNGEIIFVSYYNN